MKCQKTFDKLSDKVRAITNNQKTTVYVGCKSLYEIDLKSMKTTILPENKFGSIYSLEYIPDLNTTVTGFHHGYIELVQDMKVVSQFKAHEAEVKCSLFTDNLLITGSYDKTIKVWDIRKLTESIKVNYIHSGYVNAIVKINDKIFTASADGIAEFDKHKFQSKTNDHKGEILSICKNHEDLIYTAGKDSLLKIYDPKIKSSIYTMKGHEGAISKVVCGKDKIYTCSSDKKAIVWDLESYFQIEELIGHTEPIRSMDLLKNNILITGAQDNSIKIWK